MIFGVKFNLNKEFCSQITSKLEAILKILLLPFTFLYSFGVSFRNFLFDIGVLSSERFPFPVISVGNLSVGGTGKTPHTEYIVRILKEQHSLATLSRGYGRKTKGFKIADSSDTPETIGDEPYQLFTKFSDITVAVDEKRKRGIHELLKLPQAPRVIVLDDAFQHRYVKAGLNILLTDYSKLYINDWPLPSGRLREPSRAAKRADIIVITKSPVVLSPLEIRRITSSLNPTDYQKVFFSYIEYKKLQALNLPARSINIEEAGLEQFGVMLVSAIANPRPLKIYLKRYAKEITSLSFKDHHFFEAKDYSKIRKEMELMLSPQKIVIITEKDAVKFDAEQMGNIPVFFLPISIRFHQHQNQSFTNEIKEYVRSYTTKH